SSCFGQFARRSSRATGRGARGVSGRAVRAPARAPSSWRPRPSASGPGRFASEKSNALGRPISEIPPSDDDWYLNLLWIDRQKCILFTHLGTLFSVFRAGVRSADLRPLGNYLVAAIETELRTESLPTDAFSELEPESVRLAKTASRSTLGFMNEMAFELRYFIADAGGLGRCDIDVL